jgi:hypothetical protein
MPSVVCAVDEAGSEEAVRAAIDSCVEHGADLRLVGIVADKLTDSTHATSGERVRRNNTVRFRVERAADAARKKGVVATAVVRVGDPMEELLEEAKKVGSGELFFVRTRGRIRAAVTGQPRREPAHVSLGGSDVRELARVA